MGQDSEETSRDGNELDESAESTPKKQGRSWGGSRSSLGLYIPLSPRTIERRTQQNLLITSIIAQMDISPRKFKGAEVEGPKGWKNSPNAQQSPLLRKIKKHMHKRKLKLKMLQSNHLFDNVFATSDTPEDHRHVSEETVMASKVEVVARELIGKTAYIQARAQQGVWAQLGKPYECLGVPCVKVSKKTPLPELGNYAPPDGEGGEGEGEEVEKASFQFFPDSGMADAQQKVHQEEEVPYSQRKKEIMMRYARAASDMTRMLVKMGLMDMHDLDHARFPRSAIEISETVKKMIKKGGTYPEGYAVSMMKSHPRKITMQPLEGEQYILGATGDAVPFTPQYEQDEPERPARSPDSRPGSAQTPPSLRQSFVGEASTLNLPTIKEDDPMAADSASPAPSVPRSAASSDIRRLSELQNSPKGPPPTPPPKTPPVWDDTLVFGWKKKILALRKELEHELHVQIVSRSDRREHWRSSSPFSAEIADKMMEKLHHSGGRQTPNTKRIWREAEARHVAQILPPEVDYESKVETINRFYERVCMFINHQRMADPLMDVLVYFLKNLLEDGHEMDKMMLQKLCVSLARLPEEVSSVGRMANVMPILQFICKELHITSTEFRDLLHYSNLDRCHLY